MKKYEELTFKKADRPLSKDTYIPDFSKLEGYCKLENITLYYPHVFESSSIHQNKFGVQIRLDKSSAYDMIVRKRITTIFQKILDTFRNKVGLFDKMPFLIDARFTNVHEYLATHPNTAFPLRDGDALDREYMHGQVFFNARSQKMPLVLVNRKDGSFSIENENSFMRDCLLEGCEADVEIRIATGSRGFTIELLSITLTEEK